MVDAIAYPLLNGRKHDWSSVEIDLGESLGIYVSISELTYNNTLEPGKLRGTKAQVLARTRGEYDCEGSMTMPAEDGHALITALGEGFMEIEFTITASYSDTDGPTFTDRLISCRIKDVQGGGSQGPDPLTMTFPLDVMMIEWNGVLPVRGMLR